jgi:hypothetical protein
MSTPVTHVRRFGHLLGERLSQDVGVVQLRHVLGLTPEALECSGGGHVGGPTVTYW